MLFLKLPVIEIYESPDSSIKPLNTSDEADWNLICIDCSDQQQDNIVCGGCGKIPPPPK